MKSLPLLILIVFLFLGCANNPLDSKQDDYSNEGAPLQILLTKSGMERSVQGDSLFMMNKIQKDVDHLMMNRIIFKDSVYVLAIRREDAIFLGVSEETYDRYVEYVEGLNGTSN